MTEREERPSAPLLEATELVVEYRRGRRQAPMRALDDVSIKVSAAETVGVVGESGSGKTTLGRAILGLVPISSGRVSFDGEDITRATRKRRRQLSSEMQVVFQDPYSSLNPARTIGQTLAETVGVHLRLSKEERRARLERLLQRVGLPADAYDRFPGHFSGGQRQRIAIARGLSVNPRLLICDEPVSALDLSVQAQVINLLQELQEETRVGYVFIAHDLDVVRHLADRVIVLYRGQVMEEGVAEAVYRVPSHPYTRALLDAAPVADPRRQLARRRSRTANAVAEASGTSSAGCVFAPRCAYAVDICKTDRPRLEEAGPQSNAACHRKHELDLREPTDLASEQPLKSSD